MGRIVILAAMFVVYVIVMFTLASIPGVGSVETAAATSALIVN